MRGIAALLLASAAAPPAELKTVEALSIPAAHGQPSYRLVVEGSEGSDQDETRRLVIFTPRRRTVVSLEGGLAENDVPGNTLRSRFIFKSASMPGNIVIVFAWRYDTGPAEMRVIRLGRVPEQILGEEQFYLTDVRRGADGRSLLLIGKRSTSEMIGKCISTYDPYSVLRLDDTATGRFYYSLALSRKYNIGHYGGWAGPKSREHVGVDTCRKPPRLVRL